MNDNIQYWINQNGIQTGPHNMSQLQEMELSDKAYVWRAGMDDWKPITDLDELQHLLAPTAAPSAEPAEAAYAPVIPPIPQQPEPVQQAAQPVQVPPVPQEKCPPTNLVWAIISTILCCMPLGVIAIIYSVKVSQKYQQGDIEGAKHYSEVSAWWCIGTIIGGIVLSPFVSLIQMALMG